jgi:hypothetical protein
MARIVHSDIRQLPQLTTLFREAFYRRAQLLILPAHGRWARWLPPQEHVTMTDPTSLLPGQYQLTGPNNEIIFKGSLQDAMQVWPGTQAQR